MKIQLFERSNISKALLLLVNKKERRIQINKIRNEIEDIITNIIKIQRVINDYYE